MILLSNTFLVQIIKKKKNIFTTIHQHFSTHLLNHQSTQSIQNPNHKKKTLHIFITTGTTIHTQQTRHSLFHKNPFHNGGKERKKEKIRRKKKKTSYPRSKFIHNRALGRDIPNISCAGKSRISLGKRNEEEAEGVVEVAPSSRNMRFPRRGTRVCPWKAVGKGSGLKEVRERKLRGGYNGRQADEGGGSRKRRRIWRLPVRGEKLVKGGTLLDSEHSRSY